MNIRKPTAIAAALLLSLGLSAQAADLFSLSSQRFAEGQSAYPFTFNTEQAFTLPIGGKLGMPLPGGRRMTAILDRIETHLNGDRTWIGHMEGMYSDYRVMITQGKGGVFGSVNTPHGLYTVSTSKNGFSSLDDQPANQRSEFISFHNDGRVPPRLPDIAHSVIEPVSNQFAENSTIDVMVLYTPDMASRYSPVDTLINDLIAKANQAYIDSQIGITVRLVYSSQVNYTVKNDNDAALDAVTDATDAAFANVASLRDQYGADLVSVLRPFDRSSQNSCGVGWVGGAGGQSISRYAPYGYSIVSYGNDVQGSRSYCSDYTLAHEMGHNMGSAHDRANSGSSGAFTYSYGYGISGTFGTIMSYISPKIGKFSNPAVTCNGNPCGISESDPTSSANNALSLNNTRAAVAAFKPTKVTGGGTGTTTTDSDRVFNWAQVTYAGFLSPVTSQSQNGFGYYYRFYSTTNTYLGTKDNRLYFFNGSTGQLTDLGDLSGWLTQAKNGGF